jgi:uncharacterized protein YbaR (Trm112 family)
VYVELIDALRCPRPHGDSWLVAAALETRDRCVVRGALGCPVCRAEYPVAGGVARFGGPAADAGEADVRGAGAAGGEGGVGDGPGDEAVRLAALLGLTSAGGIVAVGGGWDAVVDALLQVADVRVLVVDPAHPYAPREPVGAVAAAPLPAGVRELARDARHWVAERDAPAGVVVPLRRARPA